MTMPYHEGELAVQARAGVQGMAARVGRSIAPHLTPPLAALLARQDLLVLAAPDLQGRPWATVLSGPPGFVQPLDPQTLVLHARLRHDDPVGKHLLIGVPIGVLAIDLSTRQRVRVNGTVATTGDGLVLRVEQAYGNCPKYIQKRVGETTGSGGASPFHVTSGELLPDALALIREADTFFMATVHPAGGTDASHRGGRPGFVRALDSRHLEFPDYAGNAMFNTLGNIEATGRAGLLFLDFTRDRALHLTGTARVVWDEDRLSAHPGAERLVEVTVDHVVTRDSATGRVWTLREASPYNPA
ncbi:hypothetical protein Dcar01_03831 [Deinococcus carri]|uniref:Pyridoxamine 5'-phosphate oxidase N-terminal domain-containing protein n=1 Tax=Deinococcus carri TaxID=1211323 RepID=A0ABP9WCL1_9DEIO